MSYEDDIAPDDFRKQNPSESRHARLERAVLNAVKKVKCRAGQQLPNGATILKQKPSAYSSSQHRIFKVLAVTEGYQPFVIWTRIVGVKDECGGPFEFAPVDYCIDGRYFSRDHLGNALEAFEESA